MTLALAIAAAGTTVAAALVTVQDHRLATHALGDMRGHVAAMAVTASIAG